MKSNLVAAVIGVVLSVVLATIANKYFDPPARSEKQSANEGGGGGGEGVVEPEEVKYDKGLWNQIKVILKAHYDYLLGGAVVVGVLVAVSCMLSKNKDLMNLLN